MNIKNFNDISRQFDNFISNIKNEKLINICREALTYKDFWIFPGSVGKHHNFKNGLVLHTLEVIDNTIYIADKFPQCNKEILITAAIWHDLAKIWDYQLVNEIEANNYGNHDIFDEELVSVKTNYYKTVHHIIGSVAEFTVAARKFELENYLTQQIQHCILSHHGFNKDWSPRFPDSIEAIILHQADMLSAMSPKFMKKF